MVNGRRRVPAEVGLQGQQVGGLLRHRSKPPFGALDSRLAEHVESLLLEGDVFSVPCALPVPTSVRPELHTVRLNYPR